MEILDVLPQSRAKLRAAVFDFDGTLSTLRLGWESVMEALMLEMIAGDTAVDPALRAEVTAYIGQSTGIQTYYQMQWLAEAVARHGRHPGASADPWWYKAAYNTRLMQPVERRKAALAGGEKARTDFLIRGGEEFLVALRERDIDIYVASGTDDHDVKKEVAALGLAGYCKEIAGAPPGRADCSKEAVLRMLIEQHGLRGGEVVVIGDGKVEIALGRQAGALALGVASREEERFGVNPVKRERLVQAGAHAIVGDFEEQAAILDWMGV